MNDIVDRIANGKATLLGVEEIITRLGVSRSTFDRWVKNGAAGGAGLKLSSMVASRSIFEDRTSAENLLKFPPADIRIGGSPKWELETFKTWLRANVKEG